MMDPRKFLKRLATELGLMKNNSNAQKKAEKVSEPADFEHRVHVALDEDSGRYVGLPMQWKQIVGRKSDDFSGSGDSHPVSRRSLTQRNTNILDDNALGHTLSQRNTGNFAIFAASLETPGSRASVADNQDLIIERLKRELRDYKARNPHGFQELREDGLLSGGRINYSLQNLGDTTVTQFSLLKKTNSNNTFRRNTKRFDALAEEDYDFPENKRNSRSYNNTLSSAAVSGYSQDGSSSTKRHAIESANFQRVLKRSESEV